MRNSKGEGWKSQADRAGNKGKNHGQNPMFND